MIRSLRAKTIVLTLALSLVPLLLLSVALLGMSYNSKRSDVLIRQQENAQQIAGQVTLTLSKSEQAMSVLAQTSNWQALDPAEQNLIVDTLYGYRLLESLDNPWAVFTEILFLDEEGEPVAGKSAFRMLLLSDWAELAREAAFDTVEQGQDYWGPVYFGAATMPALDIAVPTRDLSGGFTGLLWGAINLDKALWSTLTGPGVPEKELIYLFDESGQLIVRNDEHFYERSQLPAGMVPVARARQAVSSGVETYTGLAGEEVVGAWQPIGEMGWTVVVETPTEVAFANIRNLLTLSIILLGAVIVVAVAAGVYVSRTLTKPIETVRQGAETIGSGDLDHHIQVRSQDEIGDLAKAFNQMAANLKDSQEQLERWGRETEERVEERTRELAEASERVHRRAVQLQISAEVAHVIASIRDLDELLPEVTRLISQRFNWHHVGIFLLDEDGEYAVLRAANSEGGQRMLERRHKLKVGEVGIIGSVTGSGNPRIAGDVGKDTAYFDNPDLPETRSEMALPLKLGDRVIGALDVQSTEASAYDHEDVALLSNLADQVAIAIANASAFEETQRALEEVQKIQRQYVKREWSGVTTRQRELSYEYRRSGAPTSDEITPPEVIKALTEGDVVALSAAVSDDGGNGDEPSPARAALATPIKLREQTIGVLDLQETEQDRQWTDDEIALVRAVSDQVALALENARLFDETSSRAEQLTTLNRIGLAITSALDLNGVLQSLYEWIRTILDIGVFYVALYDAKNNTIEFPLFITEEGTLEVPTRHLRSDKPSLTGYVIQSRMLLSDPDMTADPEKKPYQVVQAGTRIPHSYLGVPLIFRDEVLGVLSVQSYESYAYTQAEGDLLATIATQASIAIQNARAYQRLVETAEQLREVDRLKTQFLANMSHELRTPLNSIIGFSRVMLKGIDGPLTDLQETDLTSIYGSGQHLLSLINSILDMSKIEAGKMDLSFTELSPDEIFNTVLATARGLLKDRPVELRSDLPENLPTVWADAQRVRQVLFNLVSNASKFTETGYISLRATADAEFMTISVEDTGIGIDEEAHERLFIPFQQVDASTSRRAGGTGLGLAISRSFVEMQGGEIWVESEPGKGSTFYFTLPVYRAVREKEEAKGDTILDPEKRVVLAVDDDEGVIRLLKRYLESEDYQVIGVTQSHKATEMAQRLAPDLTAITLDVVMPNLDGWQVLRALKQHPETRDVPVILCSIVEGLDQGLGMGAAACLQKPITRDEMLDALNKVQLQ